MSHGLLEDGDKEPWLMDCLHDGVGAHSSEASSHKKHKNFEQD